MHLKKFRAVCRIFFGMFGNINSETSSSTVISSFVCVAIVCTAYRMSMLVIVCENFCVSVRAQAMALQTLSGQPSRSTSVEMGHFS